MGPLIYMLCAIAAFVCASLLLRAYRESRARLLFWSGTCFAFLAASNAVTVLDRFVFPSYDLYLIRNLISLTAICAMLIGLVWNEG
jgi:hypothetical protein